MFEHAEDPLKAQTQAKAAGSPTGQPVPPTAAGAPAAGATGGGSPEALSKALGNYADGAGAAPKPDLGLDADDLKFIGRQPPPLTPKEPSWFDKLFGMAKGAAGAGEGAVTNQQGQGITDSPGAVPEGMKTAGDLMGAAEAAADIAKPGKAEPSTLGKMANSLAGLALPPLAGLVGGPPAADATSNGLDYLKNAANAAFPEGADGMVGKPIAAVRDKLPTSPDTKQYDMEQAGQKYDVDKATSSLTAEEERRKAAAAAQAAQPTSKDVLAALDARAAATRPPA